LFLAYRSGSDTLFTASTGAVETSSFSMTKVVIVVGVKTVRGPGTMPSVLDCSGVWKRLFYQLAENPSNTIL